MFAWSTWEIFISKNLRISKFVQSFWTWFQARRMGCFSISHGSRSRSSSGKKDSYFKKYFLKRTRQVLDQFHDSSRVVLLICLNLHSMLKAWKVWESMPKAEKYANSMRKWFNYFFWSTNAIFWSKYDIFLVCRKKNLIAQYKLLPPYGTSFATFWWKFFSVL